MRLNADLLFSLVVLVFSAGMVWQAAGWSSLSRVFPLTIGIPMIVIAAVQTVRAARGQPRSPDPLAAAVTLRSVIEMSVWIVLFTLGVLILGFTLAAFLLTFAFLTVAARERRRTALIVSVAVYVAFAVGFGRLLNVPFPDGALADGFGLGASPDLFLVTRGIELLLHR